MNSTQTKQSTIGLTRQNLESEGHLNTLEKGGGFLDTTFKITGYRKRRLSKLPAPVIIPSPPIIISCSPVSSEQNSPKTPQSPTKRYILKPITALTAAFQRTSITGRKSSPMTLLKFPKSQSNNNSKSPKPTSSPQSPKPPKSPKLLHRKGSSGSIRKRSESPTNSTATAVVAATYLSPNISQSGSPTNNSKNSFRFCKSLPSNNSNQSNLPKSPSKLGKFNLKSQKSNLSCKKALPITPSELADRLRESSSMSAKFEEENFHYYYDENNGSIIKPYFNRLPKPILIDVRNLSLYQDEHIRDSFNVNLPTLLIKRYRRGNMSNFSLDSFITTPEDRDKYLDIINEDGGKYHHDIIVFDDTMDESDKVSPGWTLLNVLERVMLSYHSNSSESIDEINEIPRGRVYWLKGGFEAFRSWDQRGEFIIIGPDASSISDRDKSDDGTLMEYEGQDQQGSNLVRRDSLFSVNTERSSLRRKKSAKQSGPNLEINSQLPPPPLSPPSSPPPSQQPQQQQQKQQQQPQQQQYQRQHSPPQLQLQPPIPSEIGTKQAEVPRGRRPSNGLQYLFTPTGNGNGNGNGNGKFGETLSLYPTASYGVHDFPNNDLIPDTPPPVTHPEIAFEVSTIIPGFLFLGPEITRENEVKELEDKGVKRILNMAFECEDTLRLKEKFDRYLKLNVKDSVEEDIEKGLKIAVNFIERAQEDNTPIYVHCRAGKSRSVTAVLAYLIKSHHWTLKHAYDYVMERRNSISPNIGFVAELMRIEEDVLGFKRNGGAVTENPLMRKEEIMDMEGVEPLGKSPKTAFF